MSHKRIEQPVRRPICPICGPLKWKDVSILQREKACYKYRVIAGENGTAEMDVSQREEISFDSYAHSVVCEICGEGLPYWVDETDVICEEVS